MDAIGYRKVLPKLLTSVVLATALMAACRATPTAAPTQAPGGEEPTQAPAKEEPTAEAEENILVIADSSTWHDIDPRSSYSDEPRILSNVYETLTIYNPPGSTERLAPGLATSWEANEDGTEWTFHLREGVLFHDGTPFTAEAVKASIEATTEQGLGAAWEWGPVEEIEIADDHTIKFHLGYAAPLDVIASSQYGAYIMSAGIANNDNEWFNQGNAVGTGPYMLEDYAPGERAIMVRFDDYWGGWHEGQFDRIILQAVADPATRVQMVQAGEVDITESIPKESLAGLEADPNLRVVTEFAYLNWHWKINTKHPPLDDSRVRQALAYSFPYEECIQVGEPILAPNDQPIPNGMFGNVDTLRTYSTDLDKAKELLTEAGHPDGGFDLLLTWFSGANLQEKCAVLWQSNLQKLGIGLEIQEMAWEAMWELAKGDPTGPSVQDVGAAIWWPTYVTPYDYLLAQYHCEDTPVFNWSYYCDAELDKLMDDAFTLEATDPAEAEDLYAQAAQMILDEALSVFIADEKLNIVLRSDIQGYQFNPAYTGARVFVYPLTRAK